MELHNTEISYKLIEFNNKGPISQRIVLKALPKLLAEVGLKILDLNYLRELLKE